MLNYSPPLREISFILHEVFETELKKGESGSQCPIDTALVDSIGQEAGRFAVQRILGTNPVADRVGCSWSAGQVTAPPGFQGLYREYCELGWPALCADESVGGQALPRTIFSVVHELITSCSQAFGMVAAINHCTSACLRVAASEELQRQWLPSLANGDVLSSMCMTEPGAGSDLGLLTTQAREEGQGRYRINGTKIFASGGDHDLTENIVHLVLARIPGAPAGSRGLSLFLVPKVLPDGVVNGVFCDGIEEKMGLHGSPTCTLRFEDAAGWLVGEINRGLEAMFPVMNEARLLSGLQAIGLSEIALQNAWQYALDRRQGKLKGASGTCALIEHPDVQRMLLSQKALTEGGRALVHWTALLIDETVSSETADRRQEASELLAILTPIVKGFLTENAQSSIGLALQVFGGHGYVVETGIEQLVRDIRVTTIYEGTTGIQAQDLLMRKVMGGGLGITRLFERIDGWIAEANSIHELQEFVVALKAVLEDSKAATETLIRREQSEVNSALGSCTPYLRLVGHLVLAFLWARMAAAALWRAREGDRWYAMKLETARFYVCQVLPEASMLKLQISGAFNRLNGLLH